MEEKKRKVKDLDIIFAPTYEVAPSPGLALTLQGKNDPLKTLKSLCRQNSSDVIKDIQERKKQLSEATDGLDAFIAPNEKKIIEKLVMPFTSAKQAYCLADYLGCIALCGMVCEMAMVFVFEMSKRQIDLNSLNENYCKVFKKRYESWGQEKRISILSELGLILDPIPSHANTVRNIRKSYLHFLSISHKRIANDALTAYVSTSAIIKPLLHIGFDFDGGGLYVPEHLKGYLTTKGISLQKCQTYSSSFFGTLNTKQ